MILYAEAAIGEGVLDGSEEGDILSEMKKQGESGEAAWLKAKARMESDWSSFGPAQGLAGVMS